MTYDGTGVGFTPSAGLAGKGKETMKTVTRYEIRETTGNSYSRPIFRQVVERARAQRIVKRLKKTGRTVFASPLKINL